MKCGGVLVTASLVGPLILNIAGCSKSDAWTETYAACVEELTTECEARLLDDFKVDTRDMTAIEVGKLTAATRRMVVGAGGDIQLRDLPKEIPNYFSGLDGGPSGPLVDWIGDAPGDTFTAKSYNAVVKRVRRLRVVPSNSWYGWDGTVNLADGFVLDPDEWTVLLITHEVAHADYPGHDVCGVGDGSFDCDRSWDGAYGIEVLFGWARIWSCMQNAPDPAECSGAAAYLLIARDHVVLDD